MTDDKMNSRKFKLAKRLSVLFTCMLVIPALTTLGLALGNIRISFALISPELYVTLMMMVFGGYLGSNVATHWAYKGREDPVQTIVSPIRIIGEEDPAGGEPPESVNF